MSFALLYNVCISVRTKSILEDVFLLTKKVKVNLLFKKSLVFSRTQQMTFSDVHARDVNLRVDLTRL